MFLTVPVACSDGVYYFGRAAALAAARLGVATPMKVEIRPREDAPRGISQQGTVMETRAVAWVKSSLTWDRTIYLRYDMALLLPCTAQDLIAAHEVCHVALGHATKPTKFFSVAGENETAAWACARSLFHNQQAYDAAASLLRSAAERAEREYVPLPSGHWFFYRGHMDVPTYLYDQK